MKKIHVGVLTYHRGYNYGAQLQARALCNRMNLEPDMDCELIDYHRKKIADANSTHFFGSKRQTLSHIKDMLKGEYFFRSKMIKKLNYFLDNDISPKSVPYLCTDSIEGFTTYVKGRYDVIIVGSDEIWKVNNIHGFPNPFFLIGNLECRKFSYAASARVDFEKVLSEGDYRLLKKALDDFEYIGVRDHLTFDEVNGVVQKQSKLHMNCDPSFIYDFKAPRITVSEFLKEKGYRINDKKKNILVLVDEREITKEIFRQLHTDYNLISASQYQSNMINVPDLTPLEWVSLIDGVDFVISSLFHGCCFSIICGTSFMALGTRGKNEKLKELLFEDTVLKDHYVDVDNNPLGERKLVEDITNSKFCTIPGDFVKRKRESFDSFLDAIRQVNN